MALDYSCRAVKNRDVPSMLREEMSFPLPLISFKITQTSPFNPRSAFVEFTHLCKEKVEYRVLGKTAQSKQWKLKRLPETTVFKLLIVKCKVLIQGAKLLLRDILQNLVNEWTDGYTSVASPTNEFCYVAGKRFLVIQVALEKGVIFNSLLTLLFSRYQRSCFHMV